jgi:hypothetical protein
VYEVVQDGPVVKGQTYFNLDRADAQGVPPENG